MMMIVDDCCLLCKFVIIQRIYQILFYFIEGPSFVIDTACSSSLLAMDQALMSIRMGLCDAALVGGTSLCLKPTTSLQFKKLNMVSEDGCSKSFDASGKFQNFYI